MFWSEENTVRIKTGTEKIKEEGEGGNVIPVVTWLCPGRVQRKASCNTQLWATNDTWICCPTWQTWRTAQGQGNQFPSGTGVVNKMLQNTQANELGDAVFVLRSVGGKRTDKRGESRDN